MLRLAERRGVPVRNQSLTRDDLQQVSELFLTGTTSEVLAIVRVDGQPIGDGQARPDHPAIGAIVPPSRARVSFGETLISSRLSHGTNAIRLLSAVPRGRDLPSTCTGPGCCWLISRSSTVPTISLHRSGLAGDRIPDLVRHRALARVRPCLGLPFRRRHRRSDRALAARRDRLCRPSASPGADLVEHRGRPAGEPSPGAGDRFFSCWFAAGWKEAYPDVYRYTRLHYHYANFLLLFFNLLPIYPLDGGQILQSILWFVLGRGRSLLICSSIGILAAVALIAFAIRAYGNGNEFSWWLVLIAAFVCLRSFVGFQQARFMLDRMHLPRHSHAACPSCGEAPLEGDYWLCDQCGNFFDMFARKGVCPHCDKRFAEISCPDCRWHHPLAEWQKAAESTGEGQPVPR